MMGVLIRDHNGNTLEVLDVPHGFKPEARVVTSPRVDVDRRRIVRSKVSVNQDYLIVTLDLDEDR